MTPQTIAALDATRELIRLARKRIDERAEDFAKDEALNALTVAGKLLDDAESLLKQAPTLESLPMVLRSSLRLIEQRKCVEVSRP